MLNTPKNIIKNAIFWHSEAGPIGGQERDAEAARLLENGGEAGAIFAVFVNRECKREAAPEKIKKWLLTTVFLPLKQ